MMFSKFYRLSTQDIFLLRPILKRLSRRRRRYENKMKKRKVLSVYKAALQFERAKGLVRERNRLIAASLMSSVAETPWYHMYRNPDDSSWIAVISLSRLAFENLLTEFSKYYMV